MQSPLVGMSVDVVGTGTLPPDSAHFRNPSRPLSVNTAQNNSSDSAAVCTKRTDKDRHLLLTTNAGRGGET